MEKTLVSHKFKLKKALQNHYLRKNTEQFHWLSPQASSMK